MTSPVFPVIAPDLVQTVASDLRLPLLREISPRMGWTLRLFVDPEVSVHQLWYPMLENGDADLAKCKERFRQLSQDLLLLFPSMHTTDRAEMTDLHPALKDLGAAHFYGGWLRKFDDSAKLQGPIWVGMRVSFRSSCKVLGPSLIESNVTIGTSAIVNRSIVCRGTEIDPAAQVADAFIGRNVYIGPGVIVLHKPLTGPVTVSGLEIRNRVKCGAVIGDGCRIGADTLIEPGAVLMPGCVFPPRSHLRATVYRPITL